MTATRLVVLSLTMTGAAGTYSSTLADACARRGTPTLLLGPLRPDLGPGGPAERVPLDLGYGGKAGKLAGLLGGSVAEQALAHVRAFDATAVHLAFGEGYPGLTPLLRALRASSVRLGATLHDPRPHDARPADLVQWLAATRRTVLLDYLHVHGAPLLPGHLRHPRTIVHPHPAFPCAGCARPTPVAAAGHRVHGFYYFGRPAPYKGLPDLLEAHRRYRARGGGRDLVVRVPEQPRGRLARLLRPGVPGLTLRVGHVDELALHEELSAAEVVVLPYRRGSASSIPLLARAHGCGLIATDVGCVGTDAAAAGGTVVRPRSPDALANALHGWRPRAATTTVPTFDSLAARLEEEW